LGHKIWGGNAPECLPVATGLRLTTSLIYHGALRSFRVYHISTLPRTSNRMSMIPLLDDINTASPGAAETTAPVWLCLIDRPQLFPYFSKVIPALQTFTAPGFCHLQCFPYKNRCLIFSYTQNVLYRQDAV